MERHSGIGRFLLALVVILVIVQSWIVIIQNRYIVKHLDKILSNKAILADRQPSDEGRSEKGIVSENEDEKPRGFVDVDELMEKARNFKYVTGKMGGTFNYAHSADAKTFNLILNRESVTSDKLVCCYDYMIRRDPLTQEYIPELVERWELSDDGLICNAYLRKDVKFHDGHPLTADDVLFTYNDLLGNKEIDVGDKGAFIFRNWNDEKKRLEESRMKVEKVNDYTVRFIFPYKTFRAIDRIARQLIYPKHILKKYADNGTFNSTWNIGTYPREIIGSGMYRPWEYISGERFVVKRNPDYWKKDETGNSLPYVDKIVFHTIVNHDTAILKFLAGELDFMPLNGEDVALLQPQQKDKDFTIFGTGPNTTIRYLCFNQNFGRDPKTGKPYVEPHKLKWFTNVKFRKAMSYALDRETWINNFMYGFGVPLWGPLSPASAEFYNPNVTKCPFNLEKAAQLLDEIGYKDRDGDGIREDGEGNRIAFTILSGARDEKAQRPIIMFISDLERIGVKATSVIQQSSTFNDSLWVNYSFDCAFSGELAWMEVDRVKQLFASYESYRFYKPNYYSDYTPVTENIENRFAWEAEIDRLYSDYDKELDREKRKLIGFEIQKVLSEELPIIFTVTNDRMYAIRNKWKNFNPTVNFHPSVWANFENMYEIKK